MITKILMSGHNTQNIISFKGQKRTDNKQKLNQQPANITSQSTPEYAQAQIAYITEKSPVFNIV